MNAGDGDLLWHLSPYNVANFKNFGIVANRGVSYCDNRIYLLTLDMTIVELTRRLEMSSPVFRSPVPFPGHRRTTDTPRPALRSVRITI